MQRVALTLFLLSMSALAAAQVITPSMADGNGAGGNCPEAAAAAAAPASAEEGRPDDVAVPAAAAGPASGELPARSAPPRPTPSVRPKTMRWHSFLPGMMK